jgi:hypothetical protein
VQENSASLDASAYIRLHKGGSRAVLLNAAQTTGLIRCELSLALGFGWHNPVLDFENSSVRRFVSGSVEVRLLKP